MTPDEKWEVVKSYYEGIYKDERGMGIKFRKKLEPAQVDMLYEKMYALASEEKKISDGNRKKFSNVVRLIRGAEIDYPIGK